MSGQAVVYMSNVLAPRLCRVHGVWLVRATLYENGQVLRYFLCPLEGCGYAKADKWGQVNYKRSSK